MLNRLGIRQKLSLLLAIPLAAVVLTMVPLAADQIQDARAASATARSALAAREIGSLIQTIQQERLLALGYLSARTLDRSAVLAVSQSAIDTAARLRSDPVTARAMRTAATALDALTPVRQRVLSRQVTAITTYQAYRAATTALLEALRLDNPAGADARGLGQLAALEALMRSNEETSSAGSLLVAMAGDPRLDRAGLVETVTVQHQYISRFRRLVTADQIALVETVEQGQAGRRLDELIGRVARAAPTETPVSVSDALTAAVSYTGLRRLAQDRVAREIATAAQSRASAAQAAATGAILAAAGVLSVVVALGVTVSRSISRPLRRLTRAAGVVADLARTELIRVADSDDPEPAPPKLAAVDISSADEIGELAAALNRVQATAALLLERQVTTRRNVAVMFANIARRTQNLVGRQLSLIDDLERTERSPDLLQRLYRLDHVATRLRRSADSLLVVSGTVDPIMSGEPTPLVDVIRSALAEIEGYRSVRIRDIGDVVVSPGLVADLRLLLAELLENATNFSPPGTLVEVSATASTGCEIVIVDHGLGLSQPRMDEENRRLVERERLDVAPTSVLGLFVVGRLARRHGLEVALSHSDGRGVTATVRVPANLLSPGAVIARPAAAGARSSRAGPPLAITAAGGFEPGTRSAEPFPWFSPPPRQGISGPVRPAEPDTVGVSSDPVRSLNPVQAVDPDRPVWPGRAEAPSAPRGASATATGRAAELAVGRASVAGMDNSPIPDPRRNGLTRRVPGAHMVDAVRALVDEEPATRPPRDPEAERAVLNDYLSGLARGDPARGDPARGDPAQDDRASDDPARSAAGRPSDPTVPRRHP